MKVILSITADLSVTRCVLFLQENLMCLSDSDRPVDLVMEVLHRAAFSTEARDVQNVLSKASTTGLTHIRACLAPGWLTMCPLSPGFQPDADHVIRIEMEKPTKTRFRKMTLLLDEGPALDLTSRGLELAPECEGHPEYDLFSERGERNQDDPVLMQRRASGSLLSGFLQNRLDTKGGLPVATPLGEVSQLLSLCAAMAGQRFDFLPHHESAKEALEFGKHQASNFKANGYLVCDRGWNPRVHLPGPRLPDAIAAADPGLLAFGAGLAPHLAGLSQPMCLRLIYALIEEHDASLEVSSYILPSRPKDLLNNHGRLEFESRLKAILAAVESADFSQNAPKVSV